MLTYIILVLHLQNHVWEDVTVHNSSLPPLAIKHPECLGLLHQLERSTDVWIQHYCILKDGCLYFYASIRSTQASGKESTSFENIAITVTGKTP